MRVTFNPWLFNPVFWHIWHALHDPKIRRIMVRGGSSAGKTFGVCDALNIHQLESAGETDLNNVFALRKHRVHVEGTVKQTFEASIKRMQDLKARYQLMDGEIRVDTGARTLYSGMDDSEKVKGLENFKIIYINELNQFESTEWDEIERRLRGKEGLKIVADWNPIIKTHWINAEILDEKEGWTDLPLDLPQYEAEYGAFTHLTPGYAFKRINAAGDTLWINITYRDNFWIVGHPVNECPAPPYWTAYKDADPTRPVQVPEGMFVAPDGNLYGYVDVHQLALFKRMKERKPNDYRIYGMGQDGLMRTGGEAWKQYEEEEHVRDVGIVASEVIHLSADCNLVPYVAVSAWQVIEVPGPDNKVGVVELRQVHELASRPPENSAFRAALQIGDWLTRIEYKHPIFVYGDPSGRAGSAVDDDARSFFDKFCGTLERMGFKVINKVHRSPPAVAMSIAFINDIYDNLVENYRIVIGSDCTTSREDYSLVKEDPKTGKFLKEKVPDPVTGQRYEKYGHFSDTKRYFIIAMLLDLFTSYKQRSRTPRVMSHNPDDTK